MSNQEILKYQWIEILKDLNKLLKLVTEQEKKYETRFLSYSNFYCHYIIIQQLFQSYFNSQSNKKWQYTFCNIASLFEKKGSTIYNIV